MRLALLVTGVALALLGAAPRPTDEAPPNRPPSILLISIDTLRADHLGLYGYPRPTDPDLLARAGGFEVFESAYTPLPLTLPAHAALLTGLPPLTLGVLNNHAALPGAAAPPLAERLAAAGYRTAAVVATPVLESATGLGRGFATFAAPGASGVSRWTAPEVIARAADALEDPSPVFLFVHFYDPHDPYSAPDRLGCLLRPDAALERVLRQRGVDAVRYEDVLNRERDAPVLEAGRELTLAEMIRRYDAGVRRATDATAGFLDLWDATPHGRGGLVIITSDHGEGLGQHGHWSHGMTLYEEALRVPLLIRWPDGRRRGERPAAPVSLLDIAPTVLAAAGLPVPAGWEGVDLGPGRGDDGRTLVAQRMRYRLTRRPPQLRHWRAGDGFAAFDRAWRYIEEADSPPVLVERRRDPTELDNGAGRGVGAEAQLRGALNAWRTRHQSTVAPEVRPLDADRLRLLESLGYVGP